MSIPLRTILIGMDWKTLNFNPNDFRKQLDRIDYQKQKLDANRPIHPLVLTSIRESLHLEWTHNSNGIEGNTLSLQETRLVLEEGITIKGKSLREHFEAVNHNEAIEYVEKLARKSYALNESDILKVNGLVLQMIEKEFAGRFRTAGVRITGANFTPPNALKVYDLVQELITWTNTEFENWHPLVSATIFHQRFVWIHPFFDGNGRSVRLLFNLLLMRYGYPPAIILKTDRKKYYEALNRANYGDYKKLLLLMIQAMERSLDIYMSNLNNYADNYQPISNILLDQRIPYGQEYVSLLARQGKIDAYKEGKNWYTTKDAIEKYINGRDRNRILPTD
ncbi:MAG: Fic family protein [Cytophagales bacterium]